MYRVAYRITPKQRALGGDPDGDPGGDPGPSADPDPDGDPGHFLLCFRLGFFILVLGSTG